MLRPVLLMLMFLVACSRGAGQPTIVAEDDGQRLVLTPPMRRALMRLDPTFAPYRTRDYHPALREPNGVHARREAPFAVLGDFNGDGVEDAVVEGAGRDSSRLVAVLSEPGGGFGALSLGAGPLVDPDTIRYEGAAGFLTYLTYVPPGPVEGIDEEPMVLEVDAFQINWLERTAILLYLEGGRFHEYRTGD